MKKLFLLLIIPIIIYAEGNSDYLNPKSEIYDFTYNLDNPGKEPVQDYQTEKVVPKEELEVSKVVGSIPRFFIVNDCGTDTYGNDYCPEQLAKATDKWAFIDGSSAKKNGITIDYKSKINVRRSGYLGAMVTDSFDSFKVHDRDGDYIEKVAIRSLWDTDLQGNLTRKIRTYNPDSLRYQSQEYGEVNSRHSGTLQVGYAHNGNGSDTHDHVGGTSYYVGTVTVKECPKGYTETSGVEKEKGECKKAITYSYFDYLCTNEKNIFNNNYNPIESGGDCNPTKATDLIDTDNDGVGDTCNSAKSPSNNCKALEYECNSTYSNPAYVDGEWKCSPFACNQQKKCGYGTCDGLPTSNTEIMPYSFHPIESMIRSGDACYPIACDEGYEYDDGVATQVEVKKCFDGKVLNEATGKCDGWEYVDKISKATVDYLAKVTHYRSAWLWAEGGSKGEISSYAGYNEVADGKLCKIPSREGNYSYYPRGYHIGPAYATCSAFGDTSICPSGTTGSNCAKTTITMICPKGYSEYGSATQCRKAIETEPDQAYSYFTYKCKDDTNAFGEKWELTKSNDNPGCTDDTLGGCINFSKETAVCRRQIHTCPDGKGQCSKNDNGQFQCTLDNCKNGKLPCIDQICDLAINDKISYCENKQCPQAKGIYTRDNKCYIKECPDNTYEFNNQCVEK